MLQPAAFAATWSIAQQPLFSINPVYPNVVFMLDDSWSMNDYRLPPPTFFSLNNRWPVPGPVTVKYGAGTRNVLAHDEFTLRSSVHNPLAYDPAINYTPWNDNGDGEPVDVTNRGHLRELARREIRTFRMPISAAPRRRRTWRGRPSATCASAVLSTAAQRHRASG